MARWLRVPIAIPYRVFQREALGRSTFIQVVQAQVYPLSGQQPYQVVELGDAATPWNIAGKGKMGSSTQDILHKCRQVASRTHLDEDAHPRVVHRLD